MLVRGAAAAHPLSIGRTKFRASRSPCLFSRDFATDSRPVASSDGTVERGQQLTGGARFAGRNARPSSISMLKITRSRHSGTTTLALSGRIGSEHVPDLRRCLETERGEGVVLDLCEVNLVDLDVVRFLVECETQGVRLAHCPAYVHTWMVCEKRPS